MLTKQQLANKTDKLHGACRTLSIASSLLNSRSTTTPWLLMASRGDCLCVQRCANGTLTTIVSVTIKTPVGFVTWLPLQCRLRDSVDKRRKCSRLAVEWIERLSDLVFIDERCRRVCQSRQTEARVNCRLLRASLFPVTQKRARDISTRV